MENGAKLRKFDAKDQYPSQWAAIESEVEREVRERRKNNEILNLASAYCAQAELDRHHKKCLIRGSKVRILQGPPDTTDGA